MNKGDIYYVSKSAEKVGTYTIEPGRPAIIVSNASINNTGNTVTVIYMTSKPKVTSPSHFVTHCGGVTGTALCETVSTIDKSHLGKYIGRLSDRELEQLNNCIRATFDLGESVPYASNEDLELEREKVSKYEKQITAYKILLGITEA